MSEMVQIICVVSNFSVYRSMIQENPFMNGFPVQAFDNTRENIGIPQRYNHFIDHSMADDAWLVFCHQDFAFTDDPSITLRTLDRASIYGPIGAARKKGVYIRHGRLSFEKKVLLGQIQQARNDHQFFAHGIHLKKPAIVETVDCCCLLVHASLVRKHHLRFDEKLDFHLYSEDFSLNARFNFGIKTRAVQMNARHLSFGDTTEDFFSSLEYLKTKYKGRTFVGTCFS